MLVNYLPLIFMVVFGFVIGVTFLFLAEWLGARRRTAEKASTYESGMPPVRTARERFSVKFYMVAMLFIIFDLEVIFIYPWAVQFKKMFNEIGISVFISMVVFLVVLELGYLYVYKKGGFRWD